MGFIGGLSMYLVLQGNSKASFMQKMNDDQTKMQSLD